MQLKKIRRIILTVIGTAAFIYGGYLNFRGSATDDILEGSNQGVPTLDYFTSSQATTPQLPLFAAIKQGRLKDLFNIRVHLWKNPDDLQSILLSGRGDIWLGHTEGFALARSKGAPVRIMLVSGWRKFFIISTRKSITSIDDLKGTKLAYAPPGSPAIPVLRFILKKRAADIQMQPCQGRELHMLLASGRVDAALIPEPIVSMLILKNPSIRVIANLEALYGDAAGTDRIMPIAGFAVNENTAARYPEKISRLAEIILETGKYLDENSQKAHEFFPGYFGTHIPAEVIRESLKRDIFLVKKAGDVKKEIHDYFSIVNPSIRNITETDSKFIWEN